MTASIDVPLKSADPKGPIVFFGTPAYSGCHPLYVLSLIDATRALNQRGYRVQHYFSQGCSIITNAREELLGAFLASQAHWLAMVDSDIGFPADLIPRMIELREPVTAAAVPYRTIDAAKIEAGTYSDGITFNITPSTPEELRKCPQKKGFVRVREVGTAFFLISRDAVMAMIRRYPDLEIQVSGLVSYALFAQVISAKKHAGEDTSFFARWSAIGGEIWVCMDAEVTHTGPVTVGGNLARKVEGHVDPAGRWLAGGAHILRDLPGALPPPPPSPPPQIPTAQAQATAPPASTPPPAPAPAPAPAAGPGTGSGSESEAPPAAPTTTPDVKDPDATLDPSKQESKQESKGEDQASV